MGLRNGEKEYNCQELPKEVPLALVYDSRLALSQEHTIKLNDRSAADNSTWDENLTNEHLELSHNKELQVCYKDVRPVISNVTINQPAPLLLHHQETLLIRQLLILDSRDDPLFPTTGLHKTEFFPDLTLERKRISSSF
ncbi:hypothetical protein AVEN_129701-1 [Araneus ventricosus]|uniref:Uncharacterized protein n=1 Tax=Araneus ventricosus TaxID=182803 RepID=A0A4Y2DKI1_ARAVE|nr:hypothetical protein AVEN_129701-1 [Araneus ventricosus]